LPVINFFALSDVVVIFGLYLL